MANIDELLQENKLQKFIESIIESNIHDTTQQLMPSLRWQKGDMPTNILEQLISYRSDLGTTGPNVFNEIYDLESRVKDTRARKEDNFGYPESLSDRSLDETSEWTWFKDDGGREPNTFAIDETVDIRDILAQRNILKDLLIKQSESTNIFNRPVDVGGATKESTDDVILAIQRLQHMIERGLDWTQEDTKKIRGKKEKEWEEYRKKYPLEVGDKL